MAAPPPLLQGRPVMPSSAARLTARSTLARALLLLLCGAAPQEAPDPARRAAEANAPHRGAQEPWPPFTVAPERLHAAGEAAPLPADGDWMIGVEFDGVARAWPLTLIASHEVVNDVVGEVAVAVTWCVTCQAPVVFRRELDGKRLSFGNAREAWRASMLLYDVETQTRWVQASGIAHAGPLEGRFLETLPSVVVEWASWRTDHPQSQWVDGSDELTLRRAGDDRERLFLFDERGLDSMGVVLREGAAARLLPLRVLEQKTLWKERVGEQPLVAIYSVKHRLLHAYDARVDGVELDFELVRGADGRPLELREKGGDRRWSIATGKALVAPAAAAATTAAVAAGPPLRRLIAYPLRKGRFKDHFPSGTLATGGPASAPPPKRAGN